MVKKVILILFCLLFEISLNKLNAIKSSQNISVSSMRSCWQVETPLQLWHISAEMWVTSQVWKVDKKLLVFCQKKEPNMSLWRNVCPIGPSEAWWIQTLISSDTHQIGLPIVSTELALVLELGSFRTLGTLVPSCEPACFSTTYVQNCCDQGCFNNRGCCPSTTVQQ